MNTRKNEFGSLLKTLRLSRNITLRRFAEMMGVAPSYLSDVENSRKAPFSAENIDKASDILCLSVDEKREINDAAGRWHGNVAHDISAYMNSMDYARLAMRVAEECNATDDDFIEFINKLKSKRNTGENHD